MQICVFNQTRFGRTESRPPVKKKSGLYYVAMRNPSDEAHHSN